jgi:hypothetical protein
MSFNLDDGNIRLTRRCARRFFFCPDGISKSWVRWFETLQMAKKTEEQLIKKVLEIAAEEQHHKAATL